MDHKQPWWHTRSGLALIGFLAIAGFFLFTEHRAHALGALPYVLLALCPLLHIFGHGGHGGHGNDDRRSGGVKQEGGHEH